MAEEAVATKPSGDLEVEPREYRPSPRVTSCNGWSDIFNPHGNKCSWRSLVEEPSTSAVCS